MFFPPCGPAAQGQELTASNEGHPSSDLGWAQTCLPWGLILVGRGKKKKKSCSCPCLMEPAFPIKIFLKFLLGSQLTVWLPEVFSRSRRVKYIHP